MPKSKKRKGHTKRVKSRNLTIANEKRTKQNVLEKLMKQYSEALKVQEQEVLDNKDIETVQEVEDIETKDEK